MRERDWNASGYLRHLSGDHGRWLSERRSIDADIALALAEKPTRIVGVWLIASTVFGSQAASTDMRRIAPVDGAGKRRTVFPT